MTATKSINLSAFAERRAVLKLWLGVIFAGPLIFAAALVLSYFVLNAPSIAHDTFRYQRAELALGISELTGLFISALALFRYLALQNGYHDQVFHRFVADNGWAVKKKYGIDKIASILLGTGESYEQGYGVSGSYDGHGFSCLIFEYMESSSKTVRYICLSFKLPKAYPMIVIDNKLNDHNFPRYNSNLPDRIPSGVELSMEGDFNKYFRVSTAKGNEKRTLVVLSPELMAALEDCAADKVDIEISNKNLFLIYEADHYSEENIRALFSTAAVALSKLDRLSKTWLASSKSEETAIAEAASTARHRLIFKSDWISGIAALLVFIVAVILMVSHVRDEPACTTASPCYQAPAYTETRQ